MQANRGRDTAPELAVRRLLHRAGFRYRIHYRCPDLRRRTIDIAFPARRVACFIDGCFWHQCAEHYVEPKTNTRFWQDKLAANRRRDRETDASLGDAGWIVLRFWEHQSPTVIADEIGRLVCSVPLRRHRTATRRIG
jgi:DNA mismatch endonuclease (patch repair protein)